VITCKTASTYSSPISRISRRTASSEESIPLRSGIGTTSRDSMPGTGNLRVLRYIVATLLAGISFFALEKQRSNCNPSRLFSTYAKRVSSSGVETEGSGLVDNAAERT
jgi:hypothetical protein